MSLYSFEDHPEHEAMLEPWGKMWIEIATSTEPADQEKMRVAIDGLYRAADLTPPIRERVSFVQSPHVAAIVGSVAAGVWWIRENPVEAIRLGIYADTATLNAAAVEKVVSLVKASLEKSAGIKNPELHPSVLASLHSAIFESEGGREDVQAEFTTNVENLNTFFNSCVGHWWRMHNGGSDDASWPAYISFFGEVAGICQDAYEKGVHYVNAARYGASRMTHSKFCIVSDRHVELHLEHINGEGRLHCEDGPARRWADGFEVHAWHGVLVPHDFWSWTAQDALREPNSEIRRAAFERIGVEALVEALGLSPIDISPDPGNPGRFLELYELPGTVFEEPVNLLMMVNGSPDRSGEIRRYGETVPAEIKTAVGAAAWQYSVPEDVYMALQRRT